MEESEEGLFCDCGIFPDTIPLFPVVALFLSEALSSFFKASGFLTTLTVFPLATALVGIASTFSDLFTIISASIFIPGRSFSRASESVIVTVTGYTVVPLEVEPTLEILVI